MTLPEEPTRDLIQYTNAPLWAPRSMTASPGPILDRTNCTSPRLDPSRYLHPRWDKRSDWVSDMAAIVREEPPLSPEAFRWAGEGDSILRGIRSIVGAEVERRVPRDFPGKAIGVGEVTSHAAPGRR